MPSYTSDIANGPTNYKSLKDLRKTMKKTPSIPPPPPAGGSYSSAGGYGSYGTAGDSYGEPPRPSGSTGAAIPPPRRGWSGSAENRMRVASETGPDAGYDDMGQRAAAGGATSGAGASRWSSSGGRSGSPSPMDLHHRHDSYDLSSHRDDAAQTPVAEDAKPSESRWGWGKKKDSTASVAAASASASASSSRSNSYRAAATQGGHTPTGSVSHADSESQRKRSWLPGHRHPEPEVPVSYPTRDPVTGRYIPPSERKPTETQAAANAKANQSWGQWASEGASSAWATTSNGASNAWNSTTRAAQDSWDSVNDAHRRDQAIGAVGSGAAKVAGGAIKYTAKGIWAIGKAATR